MSTNVHCPELNSKQTQNKRKINEGFAFNKRRINAKQPHNNRFAPPLPSSENGSLGNTTSYSAIEQNQPFQKTEKELSKLKYDYKALKFKQKTKIGKKVKRVGYCGVRPIKSGEQMMYAVQGEKGGIHYKGVQRCGCVWFCPDCMYKLMKSRADEVYKQLKKHKEKGNVILFVTFTLQHSYKDRLAELHEKLMYAFNFANSSRAWVQAKKEVPVEYLRALEVLKGSNGWHPHLHSVFIGKPEVVNTINIFVDLYKQSLSEMGLDTNEHTVVIDKWNGKLDNMTDYMFKGMLEYELVGGNLKKSSKGKTFFDLIDSGDDAGVSEFIDTMKGKRQYHSSRKFFADVRVKTDADVLKDDVTAKVLFEVPMHFYKILVKKDLALHLLNEYEYGGKQRAIEFLKDNKMRYELFVDYECEYGI